LIFWIVQSLQTVLAVERVVEDDDLAGLFGVVFELC
jgi:hypothetical protein